MSEFVEVKTVDLVGSALDWSVAMAEGWESDRSQDGQVRKNGVYRIAGPRPARSTVSPDWFYAPSSDWAHGGPLLEKYPWALPYKTTSARCHLGEFEACTELGKSCTGMSPLIAACRAIVAANIGGVVKVPTELVVVK